MADQVIVGLPGVRTPRTATYRTILAGGWYNFAAGGRVLDGSVTRDPGNTPNVADIRAGTIVGKVTVTGFFANSVIDVLASPIANSATSLTISAAGATELLRRVGPTGTFNLIGSIIANATPITQLVTYSAINTISGVVTCSSITTGATAGAFVAPTDGSQVPLTFLPDGYPYQVVDVDGNNVQADFCNVPIAGEVNPAQLLPWPSDTGLQGYITSNLATAVGGKFVFTGLSNSI